jgi:hypothetical protein
LSISLTKWQRDTLRDAKRVRAEIRKANKREKIQPVAKEQRQPRVRDNTYLAWIRRLPCACSMIPGHALCTGPIQAAHVRYSVPGRPNPGMQQKPSDYATVPLCAGHHALQHTGSERVFWSNRGVDPLALCAALKAAYDAGIDGAAVIRQAITSGAKDHSEPEFPPERPTP